MTTCLIVCLILPFKFSKLYSVLCSQKLSNSLITLSLIVDSTNVGPVQNPS